MTLASRPLRLAIVLVGAIAFGSASPREDAAAQSPSPPHTCAFDLLATGDLVLNPVAMDSIDAEGDDHGAAYDALLAGYRRIVAASPSPRLAYVNLEQPLVQSINRLDGGWPAADTSRERRAPTLGATPPLADALARAGVDVVGLANNHAYDQDHAGLRTTASLVAEAGIAYAGAGRDLTEAFAPAWIDAGGCRVAFFSFAEAFNRRARDEPRFPVAHLAYEGRAQAAVAAARPNADVIVVATHWGRDFARSVRRVHRELTRSLVDAGADVILGTGPHVLHQAQRLESPRGRAAVAFSLGNFASGMGRLYRVGHPPRDRRHPASTAAEGRDGVVLRLPIRVRGPRIEVGALSGVMLHTDNNWLAHRQDEDSVPHHIRVRPLSAMPEAWRRERAPRIRAALGDEVTAGEL